jgi:hypothetical protein
VAAAACGVKRNILSPNGFVHKNISNIRKPRCSSATKAARRSAAVRIGAILALPTRERNAVQTPLTTRRQYSIINFGPFRTPTRLIERKIAQVKPSPVGRLLLAACLLSAAARVSAQQSEPQKSDPLSADPQQSALQKADWKLQGNLDLMVGQYFFNSSAGAVNGYGNADVQLLRNLSPEAGFYIDARSTYNGFKQVDELAGGGTLFQQSIDNSLEAKWVQRFEDGYSLKPRIAVKDELFRETTDETWGKGLYDYWRYEAGVLWEHKTRYGDEIPWTWQLSYDLYYTHYPNFTSLVDQFGTEQTAPNPGSRILDTVSSQFAYRSEFELPNFVSAWALYSISFISFTDQKVVQSQGQFLSTDRNDDYQSLNLGVSKRYDDWDILGRVRPVAALNFTLADLISNQNDFDADPSRLQFIGAYYDYVEARLAPELTMNFLATKTIVRTGAEVAMRDYTGRLAQNADGSYESSKLHQYTESVFVEASYPVWRTVDLKFRATFENTSSNTSYEQTYVYNYHDYNYFAGAGWRF